MNVKAALYAVAALMIVGAGYRYADLKADARMAEAELNAAVARAQQGKRDYAKLVAAQNALDALRADADSVRLDLDRLRRAESERARRPSADACAVERAAVARCEGLLRESAELLVGGSGLLRRNAAIHDAAIRAIE